MMRVLVRALAVLLLFALAGLSFQLREIRFAAAGAAVLVLVEIALALRVRRAGQRAVRDPSRFRAASISCDEKDGVLRVTLAGEAQGRTPAPYVLLSRTLQPGPQPVEPHRDGPGLELSDPGLCVHGGIQDAYLSPRELRLTLNAHGAATLRASDVRIALPAPGEQRRLERALSRILRGVRFTSDRSLDEMEPQAEALQMQR